VTSSSAPRVAFSEVSRITPRDEGCFTADVHPEWTIGGKPNGGYLLAMLGRAAAAVGPHEHVIAASAHYLRPPEPGPVAIEASVLRAGRSASQVRARMSQGEQVCVEALLTLSTLSRDGAAYWDGGLPSSRVDDFDDCIRIPARTPTGIPVAIMDQVELRLEKATLGFAAEQPSGRGELRGWLALSGGESFDPTALLYAADALPPASLEVEVSGWVPTLEMTVYIRALPAPGPVRVLQRAQLIDAQRVDEACFIWDSTGRLVAQATQLAGIRLGSG
jgi:acyl-coenzyme A thioesterase PaaI-like protein